MDFVGGAIAAVLPGAVVTIQITIFAWLISVVVGLLIELVRGANWRRTTLPLNASLGLLRSLPQLLVLYFVFYGLGSARIYLDSFTAAVIALGIADAAYSAEYYRASFLTVPVTQREAGSSIGLSRWKIMRLIVIPQAVPFLIPPLLNSFVGLMKAATLAAAIGAPELLYEGRNYMAISGQVGGVAVVIITVYLVATIPLTRLIGRLEQRIRAPYAQPTAEWVK
jgi:polar amino acid transport system permease protein